MKRVHVVSLGCAKALVDTEVMLAQLDRRGYGLTNEDEAELYLINTCGFIGDALEESLAEIERLVGLKGAHRGSRLAVVGCAAEALKEGILERFPQVDLVAGTGALADIGALVERLEKKPEDADALIDFPPPGGVYDGNPDPLPERMALTLPHIAYVKLAEGCDLGCTFCAIPILRGPQRSRPREGIVAEAVSLVEEGVRELILVAQETTAYGCDLYGEPSLSKLLSELSLQLPVGNLWVRVLYPNPVRVDEAFLETLALPPQIPYLDFPFQHADGEVLRSMGRSGDAQTLRDTIAKARGFVPDLVLRGTALVGFPTEDQDAFDRLVGFVEEVGFDHLGIFTYSAQPGTRAAEELGDPVPLEIKELRAEALHTLQQAISLAGHDGLIGSRDSVLVDTVTGNEAIARGRRFCPEADGVVKVALPDGHGWRPGEFRQVSYTGALPYDLLAEPVAE